jgi:hypothetical protein
MVIPERIYVGYLVDRLRNRPQEAIQTTSGMALKTVQTVRKTPQERSTARESSN